MNACSRGPRADQCTEKDAYTILVCGSAGVQSEPGHTSGSSWASVGVLLQSCRVLARSVMQPGVGGSMEEVG